MSEADSPRVHFIPPFAFYICLAAGIAFALFYDYRITLVPWQIRIASGTAVALAGFAFMGWGHGRFKKLGVAVKTFLPASELVTQGAYRFSRNPMYVGFVGILAGLGWAAGSFAMLTSAVAMYLFLDWYVIRREEAYLTRRFGQTYKDYCASVRRWL